MQSSGVSVEWHICCMYVLCVQSTCLSASSMQISEFIVLSSDATHITSHCISYRGIPALSSLLGLIDGGGLAGTGCLDGCCVELAWYGTCGCIHDLVRWSGNCNAAYWVSFGGRRCHGHHFQMMTSTIARISACGTLVVVMHFHALGCARSRLHTSCIRDLASLWT